MIDQGFQTGKHLINGDILLAEIHDHTVTENIVVHGRCIIKGTAIRDFPEYFLIPVDDMFYVSRERDMNDMLPSQ